MFIATLAKDAYTFYNYRPNHPILIKIEKVQLNQSRSVGLSLSVDIHTRFPNIIYNYNPKVLTQENPSRFQLSLQCDLHSPQFVYLTLNQWKR